MANITNFKGILVYTGSTISYTTNDIDAIVTNAQHVLDYVILNIETNVSNSSAIVSQALAVAKQIYNKRQTARIWLGTPRYTSSDKPTYDQVRTHLTNLKTAFMNDSVGRNIWRNSVKGIYLNMETVYGTVDYTSASSLTKNASIKFANDVSYFVHNTLQTLGTSVGTKLDFLWIPYYGYNPNAATIIKNIGHVIAKTNIFDLAIIQPTYYFYYTGSGKNISPKSETDAALAANLVGVKSSLDANNICYRDRVAVTSRASNATATVGFEMEIDFGEDPIPDSGRKPKKERYGEYVDTFINSRSKPMCYYASGKSALVSRISLINAFYSGTTDRNQLYI